MTTSISNKYKSLISLLTELNIILFTKQIETKNKKNVFQIYFKHNFANIKLKKLSTNSHKKLMSSDQLVRSVKLKQFIIVSTNKGVMSNIKASKLNMGGIVLAFLTN